MIHHILPIMLLAAAPGFAKSSCADLQAAQDKYLSEKPRKCDLALKLFAEYKAAAPKFLDKCKAVDALSEQKVTDAERTRERKALQEFLDPPSLDAVIKGTDKNLDKNCEAGVGALFQYRYEAQSVVSAVGKKLSTK